MNRIWFSCFTSYQLFNALYYCMKVDWGNKCEKTLIWINDTKSEIDVYIFKDWFDKVYQLDSLPKVNFVKRQLTKCKNGGRLFRLSVLGKELRKEYEKNLLICFSDQHYVTNKLIEEFKTLNNNEVVLIEEGVSTYVMDEKHKDRLSNRIASFLWGLHGQRYIGENLNIDTMIVKKPDEMPKEKVLERRLIKQNNIFCDQEWIKKITKLYLRANVPNDSRPVLLWIGQPLGGDYLNETEEERVLEKIFKILSAKYQIIVKKHPSEREGRYEQFSKKYGVLEAQFGEYSWFPIELMAQIIHPFAIVTPMSAAAYNIYQMGFGGKIIYCYKLFEVDIGQDYFKDLSLKDNIYNVRNTEEMESVLTFADKPISTNNMLLNHDVKFFENVTRGVTD